MEVGKGKKSSQRKKDKEKQQMKKGPIVAVKMLQSTFFLSKTKLRLQLLHSGKESVFFIIMLDPSKHRITLVSIFLHVKSFSKRLTSRSAFYSLLN